MFKLNDYIVIIKDDTKSTSFALNHIFKQDANYDSISVQIDAEGDVNGWSVLRYDKKDPRFDWRYATEAEILHYNIINKPYDVTTLQKEPVKPEDTSYLIEIFAKNDIT